MLDGHSYDETRAVAQKVANETGLDVGMERDELYGNWYFRVLPQKRNRFGRELLCEVVSCEILAKIAPGHGPGRV